MYDLCIIGAGQSGLVTLKTFLETTKNIIVLEKCDGCTGLFSTIQEKGAFKWSTSRYMSGFSDFPMPKTVPVWFTIQDYVDYLESYKAHFDLDPYIRYNSTVKKCYQTDTGEWVIEYNGTRIIAKKLIVCAGLNQTAKFPELVDNFSGRILHTHDVYTKMTRGDWERTFTGKRILLLGGAESAYDIGHILAQYAGELYYSTKNYTEWFPKGAEEPEVLERVKKIDDKCLNIIYGYDTVFTTPTDTQLNYMEYSLPEPMSQFWHEYGRSILRYIEGWNCAKCSHQHSKLCDINETPDNVFKKYVVKRTEFLLDIYDKKVEVVYYPDRIEGNTVYTREKDIQVDIIVCATGYKKYFPFLQEDVWKGEMIKKMVPVKYKNIAFIGYARPTMGSIAAVAEMQGWWIERYFNSPSFHYRIRTPLFRNIDPLNLSNEHINTVVIGCFYLKDLAKDLHIEPNMAYLLLTDPQLFYKIFTGSCHPMMYRIHGYKSYDNARHVLMDTYISDDKKQLFEYQYLGFHLLLHLVFIAVLVLIAFLVSYSIYFKQFKNYLKYKNTIFISLATLFVTISYTAL